MQLHEAHEQAHRCRHLRLPRCFSMFLYLLVEQVFMNLCHHLGDGRLLCTFVFRDLSRENDRQAHSVLSGNAGLYVPVPSLRSEWSQCYGLGEYLFDVFGRARKRVAAVRALEQAVEYSDPWSRHAHKSMHKCETRTATSSGTTSTAAHSRKDARNSTTHGTAQHPVVTVVTKHFSWNVQCALCTNELVRAGQVWAICRPA